VENSCIYIVRLEKSLITQQVHQQSLISDKFYIRRRWNVHLEPSHLWTDTGQTKIKQVKTYTKQSLN